MKKTTVLKDPDSGYKFKFGFFKIKCPVCGNENSVAGMEFDEAQVLWCSCDAVFTEDGTVLKKFQGPEKDK